MVYAFMILTFTLLIVVEIFTVLFRLTHYPRRARFQVISMLTAVGYTTKESESILNNSVRRRLAQIVILLGYTSSATLISLFVNLYSHKVTIQETYTVGAYFLVVLLITRLRFLKRVFDKLIEDIADRYLNRTGEKTKYIH